MARKPRSDSKLDNLPEPQFMALRDGLLGSLKYEEALSWLVTDCGVSSTLSALSAFYRRHCASVLRDRRRLFALKAEEFEKAEKEDGLDFTDSAFARLKQRYFEMVLDPLADLKEVETMGKMLLSHQKLELDTERVRLDQEKFRSSLRGKLDSGLDALFEEIKGNKKAEGIFAELKKTLETS